MAKRGGRFDNDALRQRLDSGEPLDDDDFLRMLKEMPDDKTAKDSLPFLERLALL